MTKPDYLKKFDVLDVLQANPIVHGQCYFHVSNSGVTFKLIDEGRGPTLIISSQAFGNLVNEAKFYLAPDGLEFLAKFFRQMSTKDYTKPYGEAGETPDHFEESDGRNVGEVLQQAAANYSPEMVVIRDARGWTVKHQSELKQSNWFDESWKTAALDDRSEAEEIELEFEWDKETQFPFLKNERDKNREVEVSVHFDMSQLGDDGMEKLFEAERLLGEIGITFDTGVGGGSRDWEWDWSLSGPVTVTFRRFADQYLRNRHWRDSPAGRAYKNREWAAKSEKGLPILASEGSLIDKLDAGLLFARVSHILHFVGIHKFDKMT